MLMFEAPAQKWCMGVCAAETSAMLLLLSCCSCNSSCVEVNALSLLCKQRTQPALRNASCCCGGSLVCVCVCTMYYRPILAVHATSTAQAGGQGSTSVHLRKRRKGTTLVCDDYKLCRCMRITTQYVGDMRYRHPTADWWFHGDTDYRKLKRLNSSARHQLTSNHSLGSH